jgi:hypothetical protein
MSERSGLVKPTQKAKTIRPAIMVTGMFFVARAQELNVCSWLFADVTM